MAVDDDREDTAASRAQARIARIAELLGCSTEVFTENGTEAPHVRGASELLSIWAELNGDAERIKLLDFARKLAGM